MASEPKGILASVQLPPPFRKKIGPLFEGWRSCTQDKASLELHNTCKCHKRTVISLAYDVDNDNLT